MKCVFCQTENDDEARFCIECGKPMASKPYGITASSSTSQSSDQEAAPSAPQSANSPTSSEIQSTPDIQPTIPLPAAHPPLPASTAGKTAGMVLSKKAIAIIAAAILACVTGVSLGIGFGSGAWGHGGGHTATQAAKDTRDGKDKASKKTTKKMNSSKSEDTSKSQNDAAHDKGTESKNDERPTLEDTAKYHVSAQSYEFDLPQYWQDRVIVQVNGDDVTILSKSYPDTDNPVCSISVSEGPQPQNAGDVATSIMGYVTLGNSHVEVWAHRYPVISAMGMASGQSDLRSDAEYTELTDLQSGGTLDFATSRSTIDGGGSSSDNSAFTIATWLEDNLVSSIRAK